jgi:nicotinamide riboside kinase
MPRPNKIERHNAALAKLVSILEEQAGKPITARALSRKLRCTRATAYNRLVSLHNRGVQLRYTNIRDGKRGPISAGWWLHKFDPALKVVQTSAPTST